MLCLGEAGVAAESPHQEDQADQNWHVTPHRFTLPCLSYQGRLASAEQGFDDAAPLSQGQFDQIQQNRQGYKTWPETQGRIGIFAARIEQLLGRRVEFSTRRIRNRLQQGLVRTEVREFGFL